MYVSDTCYNNYSVIWIGLFRCWLHLTVRDSEEWLLAERFLLKVWFYASTIPEYDHQIAAQSTKLTQDLIVKG